MLSQMINLSDQTKICKDFFFDKKKILGQGQFGSVYLGYSTKLFQIIAVKYIELRKYEQNKNIFINQRKILSILSKNQDACQCICKLYGYDLNEKGFFLFLEYCQGKKLKVMIQEDKYPKSLEQIMQQLLYAVSCLQKENIIHKDIKPQNIIVDEKGKIKIVDFGAACFEGQINNYCLTSIYAPFQLLVEREITKKCDIWSLGVIFYEMCTGHNIYKNIQIQSKQSIIEYLLKNQYSSLNLDFPADLHPKLAQIIIKMLTVQAQSRPSLNLIKNQLTILKYNKEKDFIDHTQLNILSNGSFENKLTKLYIYIKFKIRRINYLTKLLENFQGNILSIQFYNLEKYILMFLSVCAHQKAIQKFKKFFKPCPQMRKIILPQILSLQETNYFVHKLTQFVQQTIRKECKQNKQYNENIKLIIIKIKDYLVTNQKLLNLYNQHYQQYNILELMNKVEQIMNFQECKIYLNIYYSIINSKLFISNQSFKTLKKQDKIAYINMRMICYLSQIFPNESFEDCQFDFISLMNNEQLDNYIKIINNKEKQIQINL